MTPAAVRIANCSGFYGDRFTAAHEMVHGGPIDVLTGDWLAELTMLILARQRRRDPGRGYATTFLGQLEEVMGTCLDRGIKVVSNAGGLNPAACADAVAALAARLGLSARVAHVEGDDLLARLPALRADGVPFEHLDTGEPLGEAEVLCANAYMGGWGIAEALHRGADIVITGRCTDAALAVGPAAWHHDWRPTDLDALAGAVVAGHVIECGTQATGGNYAFFRDIPNLDRLGFPIAEIAADGSSIITKHPGQGGAVTVGTVTAQLLYEITGPRYPNPDVIARFDTLSLEQLGPDRVGICGVTGDPAPPTLKVSATVEGGFRNTATLYLTGLDISAKAEYFQRALWQAVPGGRAAFAQATVELVRHDLEDPDTNLEAVSQLRITVHDRDEAKVGRIFAAAVTELGLATYPGFFGTPGTARSYGIHWPSLVPASHVTQAVVIDGHRFDVPEPYRADHTAELTMSQEGDDPVVLPAELCRLPLGTIAGARTGDKGGNANVGLWVDSADRYRWLAAYLTVAELRKLLPELEALPVVRHCFPNLRAINFVIDGLLGQGVAATARLDSQAKGLGEYLRAKHVDIPAQLIGHVLHPV